MAIDILTPHVHDLGNFTVRRTLPGASHRMVGPFIFFDHMGPAELPPGVGMDVRPHPHIGLGTVTYLFEGSGLHRDSLGSLQRIDPGDINWMLAGRGIVHSERTPAEDLVRTRTLHGLQIWIALPRAHENDAPSFSHHPAASLPQFDLPGARLRLLLGSAWNLRSPVPVYSPLFYVHVQLAAGAQLTLAREYAQRAVYAVDEPLIVDGQPVPAQSMAVLEESAAGLISTEKPATLMLLGGDPLDGERLIHWNFVASSRELIGAARTSWTGYPNEQFAQVPGETEWIPLPG